MTMAGNKEKNVTGNKYVNAFRSDGGGSPLLSPVFGLKSPPFEVGCLLLSSGFLI
jgi:hypothetical protein